MTYIQAITRLIKDLDYYLDGECRFIQNKHEFGKSPISITVVYRCGNRIKKHYKINIPEKELFFDIFVIEDEHAKGRNIKKSFPSFLNQSKKQLSTSTILNLKSELSNALNEECRNRV